MWCLTRLNSAQSIVSSLSGREHCEKTSNSDQMVGNHYLQYKTESEKKKNETISRMFEKQGLTIDVRLLHWEPLFSQQRLQSTGFFV